MTFYKRLKLIIKREAGERMYRIAEMSSTEIFIEKAFFSMKIIIFIGKNA